jgi:catechol 2,3-dioxygenase-like lactoylglutathione lyase family enzyme
LFVERRRQSLRIDRIDHIVLTVRDIERTREFYSGVLGMRPVDFDDGRKALWFGAQKINLHEAGNEFEPKAESPVPGSADLCLVARGPLEDVIAHLMSKDVEIIHGPVRKEGALGTMKSVYFRDPDGNLIEVSSYRAAYRKLSEPS